MQAAGPKTADPQVAREYLEQVVLDVDAGGQVAAVQWPDDLPAVLAGPARQAVMQWRFKPPVRDGHAVSAWTYVRLALQLVRQAVGGYGLRAVYRSQGPKFSFTRLPEYPPAEIRQRGQGKLAMEAIVHPDGTLTDIHAASHRFNHPNPVRSSNPPRRSCSTPRHSRNWSTANRWRRGSRYRSCIRCSASAAAKRCPGERHPTLARRAMQASAPSERSLSWRVAGPSG